MMGWIIRLKDHLSNSWIGRLARWIWHRLPKSRAFWLVMTGLVLSGLGMGLGWDWLRSGATEEEPNSTTIRNAGIVIAGIFALVFALWRGLVAERQAAASQRQAETAERQAETALRQTETAQRQVEMSQRQAETAHQGLLNERYQRGSEMLGNNVLAVRLGGIYALQRLAEEHPQQYHVQIIELLCAFVRNPAGDEDGPVLGHDKAGEPVHRLREDVQAVIHFIGRRSDEGAALERATDAFRLDLRNVSLQHSHLSNLNLSEADLDRANLSYADLNRAILSSSSLYGANLSYAILLQAKDLSLSVQLPRELRETGWRIEDQ